MIMRMSGIATVPPNLRTHFGTLCKVVVINDQSLKGFITVNLGVCCHNVLHSDLVLCGYAHVP